MTSSSRLVDYEQIKRNWMKHQQRLINIKPTINTRQPISKLPISKKISMNQTLEVQLQNKALLKKLIEPHHSRQDTSMCSHSIISLPKSNRKRYYEERKIRCQNEGMLKRLKQTKPLIDNVALRLQRRQTERLLNTISRFGYKNLKPTKTLLKFDMSNNQLKYLSKRKIPFEEKMKDSSGHLHSSQNNFQEKILEQQSRKYRNNEKMFNFFSKFRMIDINGVQAMLMLTKEKSFIRIEISKLADKENLGEIEVKIPFQLFKQKYNENLDVLIHGIKYDERSNNFYIV